MEKTQNITNPQSNLMLKELEKEQMKPKDIRRKEIFKVRAEINETENRKIN